MAKSVGGIRYSHSNPSEDYNEFRAYSRDWEKTYFDHQTGGYVVTHKDRIESGKKTKQEIEKFQKEQDMCRDIAKQGHKIEPISDINRPKGQTFDIRYDGEKAELKSVSSHNNVKSYVKHAIKEQGAQTVIVRIEENAKKSEVLKALHSAKNKYGGKILYYYQSDKKLRKI